MGIMQSPLLSKPSDAAKRCADIMSMHSLVPGSVGKWAAIRLADGKSDGVIYDTRYDAASHQLHPQFCMFLQVIPSGMNPNEAQANLNYWRALADAGISDSDPDINLPLMPLTARDRVRQINVLKKGRP